MALWNRYYTPTTLDEAVMILTRYQGQARVIAGGTDLLIDIQHGHQPAVEALVDITRVEGFQAIAAEDDSLTIGAGVTHNRIVQSPLLVQRATCLVESCGVVGGPQVRHVGTLGGNVAHALPAGDGTTSLVALDAEVEFIQAGVRRWAPILAMFAGPGRSVLDPTCDILIRFKLKGCGEREGCAFKRIMRPQGVALPILGCAVWVTLDETLENFADVRLCLAPVAPTPIRPRQTEAALIGRPVNSATIDQALAVAAEELHPRTSKYRATAEYRQMMIEVLLRQALPLAVERARTGEAIPEFGA